MSELDIEHLATALRFAEQTYADHLGVVGPADYGPPPEWYRGYAKAVGGQYQKLTQGIEPRTTEDDLNDAYRERAELVAALIRVGGFDASITPAPDAFGWSIVYVETPAGQCSWHIGPNDLDLFDETVAAWRESVEWDGHSTAEKYQRIASLRRAPERTERGAGR